MNAKEMNISSEIKELVIFSGGGGIIRRKAILSLTRGTHVLHLDGVPVSFDPDTLNIAILPNDVNKMLQFTTRKPTRKYIEEQLQKEADAARNVVSASVDIGVKRHEIIKVAEEVIKRHYLDQQADIRLFVETSEDNEATIEYSFIIQDPRLRWSPFITMDLKKDGTAEVHCLLTIENNTSIALENVNVNFAEFDLPELTKTSPIEDEMSPSRSLPPKTRKKQIVKAAKMLY